MRCCALSKRKANRFVKLAPRLALVSLSHRRGSQLFSVHRGDVVLPVNLRGTPLSTNQQPRFFASATRDEQTGELILKVVNATAEPREVAIELQGCKQVKPRARAVALHSAALHDENSLDQPRKVAPQERRLDNVALRFTHAFPAHSLTVLRIAPR